MCHAQIPLRDLQVHQRFWSCLLDQPLHLGRDCPSSSRPLADLNRHRLPFRFLFPGSSQPLHPPKPRHLRVRDSGRREVIVRAERDKTNYCIFGRILGRLVRKYLYNSKNYCNFGWLSVSGEGSIQEQRPLWALFFLILSPLWCPRLRRDWVSDGLGLQAQCKGSSAFSLAIVAIFCYLLLFNRISSW